jgi:flagella basal body P-ring formation protein FlgA
MQMGQYQFWVRIRRIVVAIAVLFMMTAGLLIPTAAWTGTLPDKVRIDCDKRVSITAETVNLGAIANIVCDDLQLKKRLGQVNLGKAPLPGQTRRITAQYVMVRLQQMQFDLDRIDLHAPHQIEIARVGQKITDQQIQQFITHYLKQKLSYPSADIKIQVVSKPKAIYLPAGHVSYQIVPHGHSNLLGKVVLPVQFLHNNQPYKRITVTAKVDVWAPVVATSKPVPRNKPISPDDIEIQKINLAQLPKNVVVDPQTVIGQHARRNLDAGTPLRTDLVTMPHVVKRGDIVMIIAESAGLRVTTVGKVKMRGRRGDRIRVENLDSQKVIFAQVVDARTVKIDL